MTKTVLFVTYGGGHATMVRQVIRALEEYPGIRTEILALTIGGPYLRRYGMSYMGFKDFLLPEDKEALAWGKKLAAKTHHPESGIEEEEAVAYLGLSYWDLVQRAGEAEAARLWEEKQRNAFFPISVLERVLDRVRPDMVVTTNSPRAEYAAQVAANRRGIPTLAMYDLFGLFNFYRLEADYVAVISPFVIENIRQDTGLREGQKFLITGNPAFDQAFDYRGPIDPAWRREHLPALPVGAKALLWLDEPCYFDRETDEFHMRTAEEIWEELDNLLKATQKNNGYLLIRPHPSQQRAPFDEWMKKNAHAHAMLVGHLPLYPLLKNIDGVATYSSTVGCEALLMQRPVMKLRYYRGKNTIKLADWGTAWPVDRPEELSEIVGKCFYGTYTDTMQARVKEMFPQERAAPKIAAAINSIVHGKEPSGVYAS